MSSMSGLSSSDPLHLYLSPRKLLYKPHVFLKQAGQTSMNFKDLISVPRQNIISIPLKFNNIRKVPRTLLQGTRLCYLIDLNLSWVLEAYRPSYRQGTYRKITVPILQGPQEHIKERFLCSIRALFCNQAYRSRTY